MEGIGEAAVGLEQHSGGEGLAQLLVEPRRRVSPRAKAWWFTKAMIEALVVVALVGVWALADDQHRSWQVGAAAVLALLGLVAAIIEPQWRFRVHRWDYTDVAVFTRAGWITQERRVAPISRIQTVDVERGPIAQLFGLANVTVTTASAKGPISIEGLELATAEEVVAHLTAVAARTRGDAT